MIQQCRDGDFEAIYAIINDAAEAYRGIIPADRWRDPYMPTEELRHEIEAGVVFWGYEREGELLGVMGLQTVDDVALIRHAYVLTSWRNRGIGGELVDELHRCTRQPLLVGTWRAATWAVRFYEKHGFRLLPPSDKDRVLRRYWSIPERQVETSVVLGDEQWWAANPSVGAS